MEFKGIEERVKDSVGSEILKRHMQAASEKRNKGADITKRALSGGLPAPTTTERPTQALGGQPLNAFGQQMVGESITRNALKGSSPQIKNFMEGTPPPSPYSDPQVPTFNEEQFRKDIVNNSMQKNLRERGTVLAPGGKITPKAGAGASNRDVETVNANGVVQKGTSTSPAPMTMSQANALLTGGYEVQNPFSSNQLPTTKSSPYGNVGPVVDGAEYARNLEMQKPGAVTGVGPIADGEQFAKNVEAGEQLAVKPNDTAATSQNSGTNWGARTAADNSDPNIARRRAFLDAEGSMQGLRRAEATQGIVYAGGQHHMVNPNKGQEGQNDFVSIGDKDDVRGYKSGRLSAQDMRDKYVTKIKDNGITSYDEDKVSNTAGPVADGEAYGKHLQTQQAKYKTSGVGPLADGDAYAKMLRR